MKKSAAVEHQVSLPGLPQVRKYAMGKNYSRSGESKGFYFGSGKTKHFEEKSVKIEII